MAKTYNKPEESGPTSPVRLHFAYFGHTHNQTDRKPTDRKREKPNCILLSYRAVRQIGYTRHAEWVQVYMILVGKNAIITE